MDNNETGNNNKEGQSMNRKSIINVVTLTLSIVAIVLSTFAISSNVIGNNAKRPRMMAMQNGRFENQNKKNVSPNRSSNNGNTKRNKRQSQNNENGRRNRQKQNGNKQSNVLNVERKNIQNEMPTFSNNE